MVSYRRRHFGRCPSTHDHDDEIQRFIARWQASGAAERANYQLFLSELCDVLDAPRPDPTTSDEAVFDAYGWPATLADEEILARLVELNAERAAEEARGLVRWLRPEYQAPRATRTVATESKESSEGEGAEETPPAAGVPAPRTQRVWPEGLAEQAAAVRATLAALGRPATPEEVAGAFDAAPVARVSEWLAALAALGQARVGDDGRYATA